MTTPRKKLIEVSIPLEAINVASAREKSIRHGHPSTLHLWWARRPLAACRAVLFAQLVDDPSSWPDRFPTEEEQDIERRRLHRIIEDMVPWEASNNKTILNAARWEIARSVAWGLGEEPPAKRDGSAILDYLQTKAPPVYDPFSGGGSIPLEAQRLGLRSFGSDLNPIAVLIGKALVEIPPKFAGRTPVNPTSQAELKRGGKWNGEGAQGLSEDVRYYGQWMREEVEKRIGKFYPQARLPDNSDATVIAWLWARTVRSPDPAAKGALVPLVSSFILSSRGSTRVWVNPKVDPSAPDGWRFEVEQGRLSATDEARLKEGTVGRKGGRCILTGVPIPLTFIRSEGQAQRLGARLMAVVADTRSGRVYLTPDHSHELPPTTIAAPTVDELDFEMAFNPRDIKAPIYGMKTFSAVYSPRQLAAINEFSGCIGAARAKVLADAQALGDHRADADAYADAIATYLAFAVNKAADYWSALCSWHSSGEKMRNTFGRQAIPMVWDFAEANPFSSSTGNWMACVDWVWKALAATPAAAGGTIVNKSAQATPAPVSEAVISTDPPYYDNIGYADLSDYFYGWTRKSLKAIWPDLFRRVSTPKDDELVATPYRHGTKENAEKFFMDGMREAFRVMRGAADQQSPLTIYYAFRQSEAEDDSVTSAGWASFLQAILDVGYSIDGTWPIRTEMGSKIISTRANILASSIVLVCRKRLSDAGVITRADLVRALKRELPDAIDAIRKAGVGPVDMQQSIIGPGMGLFSRYAKVLEDDDRAMTVKTALALINRVWEEIDQELDAAFDAATQVALAWFATYGFDARTSGELITLANAKNIATNVLFDSDVFKDMRGKTSLVPRDELPKGWTPATDKSLTVWECVQHTARVLNAEDGGGAAAGRLVAEMGPKAAEARALAYRLFEIATQKGWAAEALIYNELAQEWPKLEDLASSAEVRATTATAQAELF